MQMVTQCAIHEHEQTNNELLQTEAKDMYSILEINAGGFSLWFGGSYSFLSLFLFNELLLFHQSLFFCQ